MGLYSKLQGVGSTLSRGRLRRVRLAVRWMDESHRLLVDEKVREEDSERQRINLLEAQIDATSEAGGMWNAYREHMMMRFGKGAISLRSVRLALSTAAALVRRTEGCTLSQRDLDAYVRQAGTEGDHHWVRKLRQRGTRYELGAQDRRVSC